MKRFIMQMAFIAAAVLTLASCSEQARKQALSFVGLDFEKQE